MFCAKKISEIEINLTKRKKTRFFLLVVFFSEKYNKYQVSGVFVLIHTIYHGFHHTHSTGEGHFEKESIETK